MILQALVSLYDDLAAAGKLERPGWSKIKVSYALELAPDGSLLAVLPLKTPQLRGKKEVLAPRELELPAAVKRASGLSSNFLWDNASYLLGVDTKGDPVRAQRCFETAKALHLQLISGADSEAATAVCRFFETWQPERADSHPALQESWDDLLSGGNLTFYWGEDFAVKDPQIRLAWQASYDDESGDRAGRCLVTGEQGPIARLHPAFHEPEKTPEKFRSLFVYCMIESLALFCLFSGQILFLKHPERAIQKSGGQKKRNGRIDWVQFFCDEVGGAEVIKRCNQS